VSPPVLIRVACVFAACGCTTYYRPPAVPAAQLATGSVDVRASILELDGLPVRITRSREFLVGAGCRSITVKYEESYFIWGEKKALRKGLGTGLEVALAESEVHSYETTKPIHFFVPARAGYRYWITATFTGEAFIPRVVEIAPSGDAVKRFLPDEKCPK
jgi:hypothetical protein